MRIYEGSPRQDFEEVFRSIGARLDEMGMREVLLLEVADGFIVQGLAIEGAGQWSEAMASMVKQTLTLRDDELSAFMDQSLARRGKGPEPSPDHYQSVFRVIGRYLDQQRPRDVFFFEQDGSYVLRLLHTDQAGSRHQLVEFTRDDLAEMVSRGHEQRAPAETPKMGTTR
jgi:hypothetical protein